MSIVYISSFMLGVSEVFGSCSVTYMHACINTKSIYIYIYIFIVLSIDLFIYLRVVIVFM